MAGRYVSLLHPPGVLPFVAAAFVGRMPIAMYGLATLLLVESTSGSYTRAGLVAGTFALTAVAAPVQGRLADRFGQPSVLGPVLVLHTVGLLALVAAGRAPAPLGLQLVTAVIAGVTTPQLGAFVRARWTAQLAGRPELQAAFALESALDELVFIGGPILVAVLAAQVAPAAGLLVALALVVIGGTSFASLRATAPPPAPRGPGGPRAWSFRGLRVIVVVMLGLGMGFGGLEVAVIAFADEQGHPVLAGPLLALVAAASGVAGLVYGARHRDGAVDHALLVAVCALAAGLLPLSLSPTLALKAVAALVAGVAIAPTLIAGYAVVQRAVPARVLSEGFTWMHASISAGAALGAALAGRLVDLGGSTWAFPVASGGGLLAAVAVVATRHSLRSALMPAEDHVAGPW